MRRIFFIAALFISVFASAQMPTVPAKQINAPSHPAIAYVETTGNNSSAQLGNGLRPYLTIAAALDDLPSEGGVVIIGVGTFVSPTQAQLDSDNITLHGSGTPSPNWTITQTSLTSVTRSAPTALIGGTILNGSLAFIDRSRITIKNLGVDVGSDYVTGGGTEGNGIGFGANASNEAANTPAPSYTLEQGILVENVICLLKEPGSLFHGFVAESHANPIVRNLTVINGVHGLAIKTIGGHFSNITCYNNDYDGIIIKANDYSLAQAIIIDGFYLYDCAKGIIFQNKSNVSLKDVKVTNGYIIGCPTGIDIVDDFAYGFSGLAVINTHVRGATTSFANSTAYGIVNCWSDGDFVQNVITGGGGTSEPEIVMSADFTATDGTDIASYSPETGSNPITQYYLTGFEIQSNQAQLKASAGTDGGFLYDAETNNVRITATATLGASTSAALQFLLRQGATNGQTIHITNTQIQIYSGSSFTIEHTESVSTNDGAEHEWQLVMNGYSLIIKKDGATVLTKTLANAYTDTKFGGAHSGSAFTPGLVKFNTFVIESL